MAGEKVVIPDFFTGRQALEPLWVTEAVGELFLTQMADAGFEVFHAGMTAGETEEEQVDRNEPVQQLKSSRHGGFPLISAGCPIMGKYSSRNQGLLSDL
jgi:hypothetical protein